jgi:hypothetical protein
MGKKREIRLHYASLLAKNRQGTFQASTIMEGVYRNEENRKKEKFKDPEP